MGRGKRQGRPGAAPMPSEAEIQAEREAIERELELEPKPGDERPAPVTRYPDRPLLGSDE